jgi:hypothetical protein
MPYVIDAMVLPMLSSRLLEMLGSSMRNVPPGSKIERMDVRTSSGRTWSCTAKKTNAAPNGSSEVSVAASATSNETFVSCPARELAMAMASASRS